MGSVRAWRARDFRRICTSCIVSSGIAHLQAGEFLYETRLFPNPEYTFKHALTHEVTYGTLLYERRKALHANIVGAIERCYPDRLTEHVERLAHHAISGAVWERAVRYSGQAGEKAAARSANQKAIALFEQALTALSELPESPETLGEALDLRIALGPCLGMIHGHGASEKEASYVAAAELARMKVDIIFASSSTEVEPARRATSTIPIVFASHADPRWRRTLCRVWRDQAEIRRDWPCYRPI